MATVDLPSSTGHFEQSDSQRSYHRLKVRLRSLRQRRSSVLMTRWEDLRLQLLELMESLHQQSTERCQCAEGIDIAAQNLEAASEREYELQGEIGILEEQIRFLTNEVEVLRQASNGCESSENLNTRLRQELEDAKRETYELRIQNSDLTEQLSRSPSNASEKLTWEERKQLLLQQLESDTVCGSTNERERLEMQTLIDRTHCEIERRDAEIAELRKIVSEQSNAHQGVAIGATAIAGFLEQDELLQMERDKLRSLQEQWEKKLRDSEVELSRERAKLARERLEIENRMNSLPSLPVTPVDAKGLNPRGNWLARLGLKDQN